MFNPSLYETWCTINKYPTHSCDNCQERGRDNYNKQLLSTLLVSIIILGATIIIVCMAVIIFGSWKNNAYFFPQKSSHHSQQQASTGDLASSEPSGQESQFPRGGRSSFKRKLREKKKKGENDWKTMRKTLVIQALMYIVSFILTWFFPLLRMFLNSTGNSRTRVLDIMYLVFFPLQGFLNALVFVSHKVHNVKRLDKSTSNFRALTIIFLHPKDMPEAIISGIDIIEQQQQENDNNTGGNNNELESNNELDDVSKEGNVSIAAEVSFMFDLSLDSSNQKQEGRSMNSSQSLPNLAKDGLPRRDNESQQDLSSSSNLFIDNDISIHDASTVIASARSKLY